MPTPELDHDRFARETAYAWGAPDQRESLMDDEEKILAGRTDVNMPALLTRDALGG